MDKVKQLLRPIVKHHFWLLSLLIVVLAVFAWFKASGALTAQFEKNRNEVKSRFDALSRISGQPEANDKIIQDVQQQTQSQRERVRKVWEELYGNQKEKILFWPPQLGDDFIRRINQLPFGADIPQKMREDYRDYVRERFKELPRIVKASQQSISRAAGFRGGEGAAVVAAGRPLPGPAEGGGLAVVEDYLVDWNDYGEIEQKLVWDQLPASLKVWITQEDLWVYETLLNVIARTNKGAAGNHDAAIKQIVRLQVGRDAALESGSTGRVSRMQAAAGGEEPRGQTGVPGAGGEADPMRAAEPGRGGAGAADAEAEAKYLAQFRYLGQDGKPIADAESAGSAGLEFKRLPVRMELVMDQRQLPGLLASCANATLPVEVEQVRINAAGGTGGMGAGMARMAVSRREEGSPSGLSPQSPGSMGEGVGAAVADPAVVPVTIHGIIYIYMPPNLEALGISETDPAVADGTVTQPAA